MKIITTTATITMNNEQIKEKFTIKQFTFYNLYAELLDPQKIQDLGCVFNFEDNEDFFSNKNFAVEEKTFTVRAKIKE